MIGKAALFLLAASVGLAIGANAGAPDQVGTPVKEHLVTECPSAARLLPSAFVQ